jgi:hypothetical protein
MVMCGRHAQCTIVVLEHATHLEPLHLYQSDAISSPTSLLPAIPIASSKPLLSTAYTFIRYPFFRRNLDFHKFRYSTPYGLNYLPSEEHECIEPTLRQYLIIIALRHDRV